MSPHPLDDSSHIAWARLEQSNVTPNEEFDDRFLYFSAFVGTEETLQRLRALAKHHAKAVSPIAIKTLRRELPAQALLRVNRSTFIRRFFDGERPQLDRWFQLQFAGAGARGGVAVTSAGLNVRRSVAAAALVDVRELDDFFQAVFKNCEADIPKLRAMLTGASDSTVHHRSPIASVIDVGQGSMVAVFANALPVLFFDYGWPLSFYAATAPTRPVPPVPGAAIVTLSHWDFDHWSFPFAGFASGIPIWHGAEPERQWLVPGIGPRWGYVGLTPLAMAWALELYLNGKLTVWPANLRGITLNHLSVARSRPNHATRGATNDNGLFLLLHEKVTHGSPPPRSPRALLLPGDATYQGVQRGLGRSLKQFDWRGLLATHHGAKLKGRLIPACRIPGPKKLPNSWLAISSGQKAYGHPRATTQVRYLTVGHWRQQILTLNRVVSVTAGGASDARGNIELTIEDVRQLNTSWHLHLAPRQ